MRIGVLGTGTVGRRIATKLVELGHEVTMGSRSAGSEALLEWVQETGDGARSGTFADAASAAELVFNLHLRGGFAGGARGGRCREPHRQGAGRRRQPARLLAGNAADPLGL